MERRIIKMTEYQVMPKYYEGDVMTFNDMDDAIKEARRWSKGDCIDIIVIEVQREVVYTSSNY